MSDSLFANPKPDQFEHESPLRAFTDWSEHKRYAVGKGFRPSPAHLPIYLDAIEEKKHWRLVQMLIDDKGAFRSAIFRKIAPSDVHSPLPKSRTPSWYPPFREEWGRAPSYATGERDQPHQPQQDQPQQDDPVNPKHYGGTQCAQIGENLTANCYQVLKYVWRRDAKGDPSTDLSKALWYLDREIELGAPSTRGINLGQRSLSLYESLELAGGQDDLTQTVVALLHDLCFGDENSFARDAQTLRGVIAKDQAKHTPLCTTGLAV